MALPPETYERARKKAQLHVQVELDPIQQKVQEDCQEFPITGKIVRIFRGHRCHVSQIVGFDVAVKVSSEIYLSGILWLSHADLLYMKYMEVYLNGKPPNCSVALYQYELIEAPTEDPVLPSPPCNW